MHYPRMDYEEDDTGSGREDAVDMAELPQVPVRRVTAESAAAHYRENAGEVHCDAMLPRIEGPTQTLPPLVAERADGGCPPGAVYDMGPERGGRVCVHLQIVSEQPGGFERRVPLRMLPYKMPKDPAMCFDIRACQATDAENLVLEEHNRYIASLLSLFVHESGCGTSAGHVTLPSPPDNMVLTRVIRLQNVLKDKHAATMLAVRYLYGLGEVCERDYMVEDAVAVADDRAFCRYIDDKRAAGRFRFRMPGSPPASWDGFSAHPDSAGRRVEWVRGPNHSFISPEVNVALLELGIVAT
jgi:hypothetical protein